MHGPEQPTQPDIGPDAPTRRLRRVAGVVRGALADTRPLATPAYRRLWLAGVVTVIGAQLSVVAVPTQTYQLTGSSAWTGLTELFGLWGARSPTRWTAARCCSSAARASR